MRLHESPAVSYEIDPEKLAEKYAALVRLVEAHYEKLLSEAESYTTTRTYYSRQHASKDLDERERRFVELIRATRSAQVTWRQGRP